MAIIEKYISKNLIITIAIVTLILTGVVSLLDLVDEIKKIGTGNYTFKMTLIYVLLSIPQNMYEIMPLSCLIGGLVGLSRLSSTNELNASKAGGISFYKIILTTIRLGIYLFIFTFLVGELIAPKGLQLGSELKNISQSARVSLHNTEGIWAKQKNKFIHIKEIYPDKSIRGVSIYSFNDKQQLTKMMYADDAKYVNDSWEMLNVKTTDFLSDSLKVDKKEKIILENLVDLDLFDIIIVKPNQMSVVQLDQYIDYLRDNNLDTKIFELAYWEKFSLPMLCIVMFLIITPFVHSEVRTASYGQRVFLGILLGIVVFLFNQSINKLTIVLDLNPVFGAFFPLVFFFILSLYILYKIHGFKFSLNLSLK